MLFDSIFGTNRIIAGVHSTLEENEKENEENSDTEITAHAQIKNPRVMFHKHSDPGIDFFSAEEFGVKLIPNCDMCRNCKNCSFDIHQISKIEQRELSVIRNNLVLNPVENYWSTQYPYKSDPSTLENNKQQAFDILCKTERRLIRSEVSSTKYKEQFNDFIERGVFREFSEEEINSYVGPCFYMTHHEVFKEGSTSTPVRLVINSSLQYKGRSLNDVLMKGPNTLNALFGVQLRFRSYSVPLVGDITKMYHSIKTVKVERHLCRLLWRNLEKTENVKTYGIETVTFGDRPAAAIATVAIQNTANVFGHLNQKAAEKIMKDSCVDDIVTEEEDVESMISLTNGIEQILARGGFKVKGFVTSGEMSYETLTLLGSGDLGRVLGIGWEPRSDVFKIKVRINFSKKYKSARTETFDEIPSIVNMKFTKRMILSVVNSCYDPLGLLAPITIQMEIILRKLYNKGLNLDWDAGLPSNLKEEWVEILRKVKEADNTTFV